MTHAQTGVPSERARRRRLAALVLLGAGCAVALAIAVGGGGPAAVAASGKPDPGARSCFWIGPFAVKLGPKYNYAFPDYGAGYWTARYDTPPAGSTLELKGRFAHARYQSVHSYASGTSSPLDAVNDVSTRADRGSENPYLPGRRQDAPQPHLHAHRVPGPAACGQIGPRPEHDLRRGRRDNRAAAHVPALCARQWPRPRRRGRHAAAGPEPGGRHRPRGVASSATRSAPAGTSSPRRRYSESLYMSLREQPGKPPTFPARLPVRWRAYYSTTNTINCTYLEVCDPNPDRTGGQYSNLDNNYVGAYLNREYGHVLVLHGKMPRTPQTMHGERQWAAVRCATGRCARTSRSRPRGEPAACSTSRSRSKRTLVHDRHHPPGGPTRQRSQELRRRVHPLAEERGRGGPSR